MSAGWPAVGPVVDAVRCGFGGLAVIVGMGAGSAFGQTAPPAPVSVSATATLVSDYRFRGLSQTNRDPAVQASVAVDTLAGLYVDAFASTVGGYVARGADAELDLTAGYRKTVGGTTIEGGLRGYFYPGHGAGATTVAEPFISAGRSYGPLTGRIGAAVAWKQRALGLTGDRRGGAYLFADLSAGIPRTPITLTAHAGRSFVPNAITFGRRYTDWRLGGSYAFHALAFGLSYVDADSRATLFPHSVTANPRNVAGGTALASIGVAF